MTAPAPKLDTARRSWGRLPTGPHQTLRPRSREAAIAALEAARKAAASTLPHGLGRSYGDSNLNPDGGLILCRGLDHFIAFDRETGFLRAEAGVSLDDILRICVPHGFFLPVSPGTRQVTLGGAIANDVHGKNHHRSGTFGCHVRSLTLARSDGSVTELTPDDTTGLFAATIGGLGLTGVILEAEIALMPIPSAYLDRRIDRFANIAEFLELASERSSEFEHTVAWVDCTATGDRLGQGVFTSARWAKEGGHVLKPARSLPALPVDLPGFALNRWTLKGFNQVWRWRQGIKPQTAREAWPGLFHPLDALPGWNRLYGAKGFYQHQCVIPFAPAQETLTAMLSRIAASGQGSFLAVLKTFGDVPSPGLLSFPAPGVTLALDFANKGAKTRALLADLDAMVVEAGGRLYPAKDAHMSAQTFKAGYPSWEALEAVRDPALSSAFWRRVTQ